MRSLAAGVLLVVFAVLLPTLNLGTWAERVIFDEDTFVAQDSAREVAEAAPSSARAQGP